MARYPAPVRSPRDRAWPAERTQWLDRDLDLLEEALRPSLAELRARLPRSGAGEIIEQLQLAIGAAFAGDQAAAAACIAQAESLYAALPASREASPAPTSRKASTIIRRGITGHAVVPVSNGTVLAATDGSIDRHAWAGWAYLATDGQWGCQANSYRSNAYDRRGGVNGNSGALVTELRAVYLALTTIPGQLTVLADSTAALRLLEAWQNGDVQQMPSGYSLRPRTSDNTIPTLVRLARLTADRGAEVTYTHVKGHAGHLLNEAADALAGVARRWVSSTSRPGQAAMIARAADIAASFLTTWSQQSR
jgi:ribonuclease HI